MLCHQLPCWPRAAGPSREFPSLAAHFSPMLSRGASEMHRVDYFCFSCRWQCLCCITPPGRCAKSCPPQSLCPAWAQVMATGLNPLCDSLHLFFSFPENPSSSIPCKQSSPHLAKHFGDIFLMLSCNESLSKYADVKGCPRIIFVTLSVNRLESASSASFSQSPGSCWVRLGFSHEVSALTLHMPQIL